MGTVYILQYSSQNPHIPGQRNYATPGCVTRCNFCGKGANQRYSQTGAELRRSSLSCRRETTEDLCGGDQAQPAKHRKGRQVIKNWTGTHQTQGYREYVSSVKSDGAFTAACKLEGAQKNSPHRASCLPASGLHYQLQH